MQSLIRHISIIEKKKQAKKEESSKMWSIPHRAASRHKLLRLTRETRTLTDTRSKKKNVVAPKNENKKNNDVMCILILVCRTL